MQTHANQMELTITNESCNDRLREHQRTQNSTYRHQRDLYNESFCVDGLFDALAEEAAPYRVSVLASLGAWVY